MSDPPTSASTVVFETIPDSRGFVILPNLVLLDTSLSAEARLMYALFVYYARQKNVAWPGMDVIADKLCLSRRRARPYRQELERAQLLRTERRGLKTNLYTLLSLDRRVKQIRADRAAQKKANDGTPASHQNSSRNGTPASPHDGTPASHEVKAVEVKGDRARSARASAAIRISGTPVAKKRWALTERILAEYNRQAGQKLRLLTSAGQPSLGATRIYKALLAYPDITFDEHADIIRRTLSSRWWGADRPNPGVVFGPKVFEDNITRDPTPVTKQAKNDKIAAAFADARLAAEEIAREEAAHDQG